MTITTIQTLNKTKPYVPPLEGRRDYSGLLLDFNEKIMNKPSGDNLYPEYGALKVAIATYCNVESRQVLLTAGAGSAIDLVFRAYCEVNDEAIIPAPSFGLFYKSAQVAGARIVSPEYDQESGQFPLNAVLKASSNPKIVVICNPNNPTGTVISLEDIAQIAKCYINSIIVVDEAYFEYCKITAISLQKQYPNIVVIRTFSKAFGLAALRVGYIIASEQIIKGLQKVSNPYDIAMPSATAAQMALGDLKAVNDYTSEVMVSAKETIEKFFIEFGIPFYLSGANFILFKPRNGQSVFTRLKNSGIMVRNVVDAETYRVTVGDVASATLFVEAYRKLLLKDFNNKVAFLDRDGTLINEPQDTFQVDTLEQLKILPGAITGLRKLIERGFSLVMVTNQNGIGTEEFPRDAFLKTHNALLSLFAQKDIRFDRVLICPHLPEENCTCRKPKLGLVTEYLEAIDQNVSLLIGDRQSDIVLADAMGIKSQQMPTNGNFLNAVDSCLKLFSEAKK